jgi:HEAT repeats/von Willebrand factor type A domain
MHLRPRAAASGLLALLVASASFTPPARAVPGGDDEALELVARIRAERDTADPDLIRRLADLRTREAMQGLVDVYKDLGSIYMRREVVRALATFDDVPEAWEPALEAVANVATNAVEPELREAAIAALGRSARNGKRFLRMIVESPADDGVREDAMAAHVRLASPEDKAWYRELYQPPRLTEEELREKKKEDKRKKVSKKRGEEVAEEVVVPTLGEVRRLAFDAIVGDLTVEDLAAALHDGYPPIRGVALLELERRKDGGLLERAQSMYADLQELPDNRAAAAGVIARAGGTKPADDFIDVGTRFITPDVLRNALADLLREMNDPDVDRKLLRKFGKGKRFEKLFVLRATWDVDDDKYGDKVVKLLRDKDPEVACAACSVLARRGDASVAPDLRKLVDDEDDLFVRRAAMEALARLRSGQPGWEQELCELAASPDVAVRDLALKQLARTGNDAYLPRLEQALASEEWSTRLAALEGLELYRSAATVPLILAQMEHETGRMVRPFADALWRLTGQPFEANVARWKAWWQKEGAGFQVPTEKEIERLAAEREERRLREVSRVESEFFGIHIVSRRVIFVLDISGSMNEPMRSTSVGQGRSRMDVAREQLKKAIGSLEDGVLFNVLAFSFDLMTWVDGVEPATEQSRKEAAMFVDRLGVGGGTNLYGALRRAFEDPDVDTIFVVSDGEPAGGVKDDPADIRADVASWNAERGIVIHTIAVGGRLQILRWLAEDSGGSHVQLQ